MESVQDNLAPDWRKTWRQDFAASLVVFLVALPLCMGIALASGAPVATGLVTGIIGGIIVGSFAGAPLQVSGPAAGLTVICGEVIREQGLHALGIVVMIAGGLQLAAGLLKLGQWFRAVSPAVIHGMLSGIGILILSSQLHVMVDDRPRHSGLANLASMPEAIWKGLPLPRWETPERRRERIEFLQLFGRLHEEQREIKAEVLRVVTRHGSDERHAMEAEQLAIFIPRQRQLTADIREARERLAASTIVEANGRRADALEVAVQNVDSAANQALADLEAHRVESVDDSLAAADAAVSDVLQSLKSHDWAAKVGLLSILVIIGWQTLIPKRMRMIPGPLVSVFAATLLAWACALPVLYVEVPDNILNGLTFPSLAVFQDVTLGTLLTAGVMMAVIASAETLLCATAVDRMHQGPRTQYDRELAAQGVGNLLCGTVGALPMTGVIVRSAANVQAGGKTRLSAILHGIWLLLFVVALGFLLRMIPIAALAGILVYTGFKLIDWKGFLHLWKYSRSEAAIFLIVVTVIVVEDLLIGVITGVVLSAIKLLVTFSHLRVQMTPVAGGKPGHGRVELTMSGAATFLRLPVLAAKLDEVPRGAELHVDLSQLDYVDHACLELLMAWAKQHESAGGRLVIDWGELHARFRGERGRNAVSQSQLDSEREPVESTVA
jgi:MFS superfamily sulfate permease-like transporter